MSAIAIFVLAAIVMAVGNFIPSIFGYSSISESSSDIPLIDRVGPLITILQAYEAWTSGDVAGSVIHMVAGLVYLWGMLLLMLNLMMVFIKTLTDAVVATLNPAVRRRLAWQGSVGRAIGMVVEMLGIYLMLAVAFIIIGIVAIAEFDPWLGALLIIAGLLIPIVGIFAVVIRSITNSVVDHMPESDTVSRISRREAMRRAFVLFLSLISVYVAGGGLVVIGGGIVVGGVGFGAFQDSAIIGFLGILVGGPLFILGIIATVAGPLANVIWQISSSVADHVTGDIRISFRIKTTDRFGEGLKWFTGLFFQIVAVYILAGVGVAMVIAVIGGGLFLVRDVLPLGEGLIVVVWWLIIMLSAIAIIAIIWVGNCAIIIRGVSNAVTDIASNRARSNS